MDISINTKTVLKRTMHIFKIHDEENKNHQKKRKKNKKGKMKLENKN